MTSTDQPDQPPIVPDPLLAGLDPDGLYHFTVTTTFTLPTQRDIVAADFSPDRPGDPR